MKIITILAVFLLATTSLLSATTSTTTTLSSSLNPSIYGQTVTFTAVVTSQLGAPPDGEMVTFLQGSKTLGTAPLSGGSASFTISTLTAGGTDNIKAVYAGDSNFAKSTSNVVGQVVTQASTTTTVASSQNPSSFGQSVTLTASVAPEFSGTVTGNVAFYNGSTKLGTGALAGGVASYTTAKLGVGTDPITAVYNGSSSFLTSTSNALNQIVNQDSTTTTLASSQNPSTVGQSVTFTAIVTSQSGGSVTGTVTFSDGGNVLKTGTLSGGVGKLTIATLPTGTQSITATYNGSANFTGSSASLTQTVNPKGVGTYIDATMNWDSITRYYEVYLPANLPANPPLLLMLHGTKYTATFDPESIITQNWGWPGLADQYGFILVKPASTWDPSTQQWNWNAYYMDAAFPYAQGCGAQDCPDDSGFLRQLIVNLTAQYNVNPNAVFVTGMSSGAQMTERVGNENSDLVAAIAPASGQLVGQQVPPPVSPNGLVYPDKPLSVQEWHGTLDHNLWPCNYGTTKYSGVTFTLDTVDDTFNYWVQQNACSTLQTTETLCLNGQPNNANDAPSPGVPGSTGNDATSCAASNIEVQFIWEPDIGHSWNLKNNTARWQFFASHPKQ